MNQLQACPKAAGWGWSSHTLLIIFLLLLWPSLWYVEPDHPFSWPHVFPTTLLVVGMSGWTFDLHLTDKAAKIL